MFLCKIVWTYEAIIVLIYHTKGTDTMAKRNTIVAFHNIRKLRILFAAQ